MPIVCDSCGFETSRYSSKPTATGFWNECRACSHPVHANGAVTGFSDLTLEHAHDESGQPIRVTSLRQLREAEKRYGFKSCVANMDSENFDKPPQTKIPQMSEAVEWLYPDIGPKMFKEIQEGRIK